MSIAAVSAASPPAATAQVAAEAEGGSAPSGSQRLAADRVSDGLSAAEWTSMQAQMRLAQYQVTWQVRDGAWAFRAPNPAQGFDTAFATDGFTATAYAGGQPTWRFGLRLMAYGDQPLPDAIAAAALSALQSRVEYRWTEGITEWYENKPEGVEHGLTLHAPPSSGAVRLDFALSGDLRAELDGSGGLRLRDVGGTVVLHYDGLTVTDATGQQLPARLSLSPGGERPSAGEILSVVIDAAGGIYPLVVDPLLHGETVTLRASDAQAGDRFAWSVAASGDVVVVGAPEEDGGAGDPLFDAGAAYVFGRSQGGADNWGQVRILRASDAQAFDNFGLSVAVSGDVIVVGAPAEDSGPGDPRRDCGAVYVFQRDAGGPNNWGQVQALHGSDAQDYDWFGYAVAVSGHVVVVGAQGEDGGAGNPLPNSGAVYVFRRDQGSANNWGQVQILRAPDAQARDAFGLSVAISGDVIVVGASWEDGGAGDPLPQSGAAYVFQREPGGADTWVQTQTLRASDAQAGDYFGRVAVEGDVVVVGAWGEDGGPGDPLPRSGAAYVFQRNQGGPDAWGQVQILRAADAQMGDDFGAAVAVSGEWIIVGARSEDGGAGDPLLQSGAAYVFQRDQGAPNSWDQLRTLRASDAQSFDSFGISVAISGDVVVVGAYSEDGGAGDPLPASGAACVFERSAGGGWEESVIRHAPDGWSLDYFGDSVAISGDVIVVGAPLENGGPGNPFPVSGAAYVFHRDQGGAGNWGAVRILRASDAQPGSYFGDSVAVSGDVIVVGSFARNAAYVFRRSQGGADNWGQVRILHPSDAQADDWFGRSVAISGDVIAVGAPFEDGGPGDPVLDAGAAYIFERDQGGADNWGQVRILRAHYPVEYGWFGWSVALSGDVLVVGTYGSGYVFERDQGGSDTWGQAQILHLGNAQMLGAFGESVAVSGNVIVVGAPGQSREQGDSAASAGVAYVFQRDEDAPDHWGHVRTLHYADGQPDDQFGYSVAISGDVIAVGVYAEDGGAGAPVPSGGAVCVFQRDQGGADNWGYVQILRASDGQTNDMLGFTVAISGGVIVAGAYAEDGGPGNPFPDSGAIYIFQVVPNRPPVADDDVFAVVEDSADNPLDVLDGDLDPEGDPLAIFAVGTPNHGGFALNGGTIVIYTPAMDFFGDEVFTYTVSDGQRGLGTATVTVTVSGLNDPPVADDDTFIVASNSIDNRLGVLDGDVDVDGDVLVVCAVSDPPNGMAVDNDTNVLYTPDPGFFGSDVFTYTVSDDHGGFDTATVTVTVTARQMSVYLPLVTRDHARWWGVLSRRLPR